MAFKFRLQLQIEKLGPDLGLGRRLCSIFPHSISKESFAEKLSDKSVKSLNQNTLLVNKISAKKKVSKNY